jgi:prophage antirepressor-like protein
MSRNKIIKSVNFGEVQCDIYRNNNEYYMTREQIGMALEYSDPQKAIDNIHARHKDRLNKYSVTVKLRATDGKMYDTTVYNRKGIMEVCRHSQQPKADAFMDWIWDVMEGLMTGKAKITIDDDKQKRLEITEKNARARTAKIYLDIAKAANTENYKDIMLSYAAKELSGEYILPLPVSERKTYSASEIGKMFSLSSNMTCLPTVR